MLFYLFTLFAGTLFFIPAIFVSRFTTAHALWMQVGIIIGISSFVFLKRTQIFLPSYGFLFLVLILTLYYLWRARWHIEAIVSATLYCSTLLLFYQFFNDKINRNKLFNAYTVSAVLLCIWCAGQLAGWLPSYHNTLIITGPFDNPAGISAALSLLLPFVLYGTGNNNRRVRTINCRICINSRSTGGNNSRCGDIVIYGALLCKERFGKRTSSYLEMFRTTDYSKACFWIWKKRIYGKLYEPASYIFHRKSR